MNEITTKTERPTIVTDDHLFYLDRLRESGAVNMLGAGSWISEHFSVSDNDGRTILSYWMKSSNERNKNTE